MVVLYSALIEIGEFGWFDLTVTVSFEFLIGAGVEIEAVQVACGPVVVASAALVVIVPAALVVCVDDRVVGGVFGGLVPLPPQPVNPMVRAETANNQRLRANTGP